MKMKIHFRSMLEQSSTETPQAQILFYPTFYFILFYCCSLTVVLHVPHCSPLPHPPILVLSISPRVHAHESSTHVPQLVPSPSFPHYLPPPSPLVTVNLFFISKSLILFCSFICFVDQVPLGEIIWYLSFTAWLTSLIIMLSSFILLL